MNNYPKVEQGFFVKIQDNYSESFDRLNEARSKAKSIGKNLEIYHGKLKRINEENFDDSQLCLIPKIKK